MTRLACSMLVCAACSAYPVLVPPDVAAHDAGVAPARGATLTINRRAPTKEQLAPLVATYGQTPPDGDWWYDPRSGIYGQIGRGTSGHIAPGFDFGALPADASSGTSGIYFNGRQLTLLEGAYVLHLFGVEPTRMPEFAGQYALDALGELYASDGRDLGNLFQLSQQKSGGDCQIWSSSYARGNSCGGCSYVNVGGSFATKGCG